MIKFNEKKNSIILAIIISAIIVFIIARLCYSFIKKENINYHQKPDIINGVIRIQEYSIGLSTGGAKDINNFRENIKNGYFPISTDIT